MSKKAKELAARYGRNLSVIEIAEKMAGIYDSWLDRVTGEVINTFSIITTKANPLTDYIHNTKHRMPAILHMENEERWLDPKLGKSDIEELLHPFPAEKMDAYVINNDLS